MKLPPGYGDFPVSTSEKVVFISVTHNHMMAPRRCSIKSAFTCLTIFIVLWFSANLVREIHQMKLVYPEGAVGVYDSPRRTQHFQSRFIPKDGDHAVRASAPREWDTSVLSQSVSVRPQCSNTAMLLILITSAPGNFKMRAAIRETWCAKSSKVIGLSSDHKVQFKTNNSDTGSKINEYLCIFLIGRSGDAQMDSQVREEIDIYDDILYGEYTDTYRNLTFKVLTGFLWSSANCLANFMLKTDDDCFVNVATFLRFLSLQEMKTNVYAGRVFLSQEETRVIREPQNKWWVPEEMYAPEYYPPYVSGTGYLMSSDVLHRIIHYSRHYEPFPNEDAYIGVLAEQLHIHPIQSFRFTFISTQWSTCNLQYLLVLHRVDEARQRELQSMADEAAVRCANLRFITRWE